MTTDELIIEKFEVRQVGSPPLLCWSGSHRHRLLDSDSARQKLADLFSSLKFNIGAEVGVDRGKNAERFLLANPDLLLFCVDPWSGQKGELHYQDAIQRLVGTKAKILRMPSSVAIDQIEYDSLDFVYMDAQRDFNSVMLNLINWSRRVKKGGIISGRGYCNLYETGVVKAVDAYVKAHNIRNWYITREVEPNYFWVKNEKS